MRSVHGPRHCDSWQLLPQAKTVSQQWRAMAPRTHIPLVSCSSLTESWPGACAALRQWAPADSTGHPQHALWRPWDGTGSSLFLQFQFTPPSTSSSPSWPPAQLTHSDVRPSTRRRGDSLVATSSPVPTTVEGWISRIHPYCLSSSAVCLSDPACLIQWL